MRDGLGSKAGNPWGSAATNGIYVDDNSERITVQGNTSNVGSAGIFLHNTRDVTVTNNVIFAGVPYGGLTKALFVPVDGTRTQAELYFDVEKSHDDTLLIFKMGVPNSAVGEGAIGCIILLNKPQFLGVKLKRLVLIIDHHDH